MVTKTCPSCGADVPTVAARCKHCFYDFSAEGAAAKKSGGFVGLLGFVFLLLLGGVGVSAWLYNGQQAEKVIIDQESKSIVFTRTSAGGTETERLPFERIGKIQHTIGEGDKLYEVVALGTDGQRWVIKESDEDNLSGDAGRIARIMGKPMEEIDNTPGRRDASTPAGTTSSTH